ncbi:FkbM family methyltransferase [Flaviaesturariibacter flavus]|uniref:FkbM family methyltransferase n=1 Tax=Flaviaesturariibacter flavus TaxID=2502780 RepID=A0A4V6NB27_9BACT|nr:FkbM family methyltransferase [Flaviaesturariibacter flavus]TCJ17792.1 FkbM family methyltransferase [Flaviaesturariibacter flavus]
MATLPAPPGGQFFMNKDLIFDIGMHEGEDTRYYLKRGYRVVAVEANPLLARKGEQRFAKAIADGQLTILNVGVGDHEGILPFYINGKYSEWSSFDKATGTRDGTPFKVIEVPCVRTAGLFEKYGIPYYLKVDIEGFDHYPLRDINAEGDKPRYVSCEAVQLEWLTILRDKGYTKFKMLHQGYGYRPINLALDATWYFPKYQVLRNGIKRRLQRFLPFRHLHGSTGPFGEDTRGSWHTYEEVAEFYRAFYQYEKKAPLNTVSWYDFHATF